MSETATLLKQLIEKPSITPNDCGCMDLVRSRLEPLGFKAKVLRRGLTDNLWLQSGKSSPMLLFAGHTDVVPPGAQDWDHPPFEPIEEDGRIWGRGSQDMKGGVAAFTIAAQRFVQKHPDFQGSIAILLTSDEEGDGRDGTSYAIAELEKLGIKPDFCIVGEPSCQTLFGDTIKNARRGSLNGRITVKGKQGHVAYPEKVRNPIHQASAFAAALSAIEWDQGDAPFPATSLQITNIHAGTGAVNVVPPDCEVVFNIRFNTLHTPQALMDAIERLADEHCSDYNIHWQVSALPFRCQGNQLVAAVSEAVAATCGVRPELSAAGGTSDARFISRWCPEVLEFGTRGDLIHQKNESVSIADIDKLTDVYEGVLERIFL